MKKKLFAVSLIVSVYSLFIFAFTSLDNQGNVTKFFTELGLSNAQASTTIAQAPTDMTDSLFRLPVKKPKSPADPKN